MQNNVSLKADRQTESQNHQKWPPITRSSTLFCFFVTLTTIIIKHPNICKMMYTTALAFSSFLQTMQAGHVGLPHVMTQTMTVLLKNLFTVHFQFDLLKLETNNSRDDKLNHAWIIARWTVAVEEISLWPPWRRAGLNLIQFDPRACNMNGPPIPTPTHPHLTPTNTLGLGHWWSATHFLPSLFGTLIFLE